MESPIRRRRRRAHRILVRTIKIGRGKTRPQKKEIQTKKVDSKAYHWCHKAQGVDPGTLQLTVARECLQTPTTHCAMPKVSQQARSWAWTRCCNSWMHSSASWKMTMNRKLAGNYLIPAGLLQELQPWNELLLLWLLLGAALGPALLLVKDHDFFAIFFIANLLSVWGCNGWSKTNISHWKR